jgi:hypothetical protein
MSFTRIKTCTDYRSHDSHHLVTGISLGKLPRRLSLVVVKELLLQETLHVGLNLLLNLYSSKLCDICVVFFELKEFQCNRTGQKKELLILKGTTLVRLHLHPVTGLIISCLPLQLGDFQGALHVACRWLRILCFIGTREAGFKLNLRFFKLNLKL